MCPIARTAAIIGGKWTLLIIRELETGPKRFTELERALVGISPKTLSERLRHLERSGVLERRAFPALPARVEYALTRKGEHLMPILTEIRAFGEAWT